MKKFKCKECGHKFKAPKKTTQCPSCGSHKIKKKSHKWILLLLD